MTDSFNPYHLLLSVAPKNQPPDHYQLLGIERLELNADVISNAAERQCDQLKRHSGGKFGSVVAILESAILTARDCLLNRDSHRRYAADLQGFVITSNDVTTQAALRDFDNEFDLMWQSAQQLDFDPQYHWLGIPRHQRPASNFRLLGIESQERNPTVIQNAAERQIAFVRKFASGNQADQANELLRQLGRARAALTRDEPDSTTVKSTHDGPQQEIQRLRIDGPESVARPVSSFGFENREATTDSTPVDSPPSLSGTSRLNRRRRRGATSKLSSFWTALVWIVPFVLPTAAIVGYLKWTGDGAGRIVAALDALKSPAEPEPELRIEEPLTPRVLVPRVEERQPPAELGTRPKRRLPDQNHAKPKRNERIPPGRDLGELAIPNAENNEESAYSATPEKLSTEKSNPNLLPTIDSTPREHQFFNTPRTWSIKGGRSFEASVISLTRDHVMMKSAKNGHEVNFDVEDFTDKYEAILRIAYLNQQDGLQFDEISKFVSLIPSLPQDVADTLNQSNGDYPGSPYAGLWRSVVISESENEYAIAKSILRKVIKQLDQQRIGDPERQAMTLASSLNNLAVCMIMDHQISAAAVSLTRSLQVMPISSPIILHNSNYLLQLGTEQQNQLKLSSMTSRKLKEALKAHPKKDVSMGQSWYYALDVDLPRFANDSQTTVNRYLSQNLGPGSVRSKLAVRHSHCVACQGRGYHVCRNCLKGTVSVSRQVRVGETVTGKPIMGPKVFPETCPSCRGRGSFDCRYCTDGRLK